MKHNDYLCLGAGAARAWDNMEAALDLANSGECDYLVFDSLTEKTSCSLPGTNGKDASPGTHISKSGCVSSFQPAPLRIPGS